MAWVAGSATTTTEAEPAGAAAGDPTVARFVSSYCLDCHTGQDAEAGLALDSIPDLLSTPSAYDRWRRVARQVRFGAMPPADYRPRPSDEDRTAALRAIKKMLQHAGPDEDSSARVVVRRLNTAEYDNTLRDLLGIDFSASGLVGLPADEVGNGFDNQGSVQSFSPLLMEKYLDAAEKITRIVIVDEPSGLVKRTLLSRSPSPASPERPPAERLGASVAEFLPRVYRRPVSADEVQSVVGLAIDEHAAGSSYEESLAAAVAAALVSPHFLFRAESSVSSEPGGYGLASRLSYFLWASMPDERLFRLAAADRLATPAALRLETERMLADPKAESLATRFFAQWLGLDRLQHASPAAGRYRKWGTRLQAAMREETLRLIRHAVREDLGLLELFGARYTFVNPRLAELYGVPFDGEDPRELYLGGPGVPPREERAASGSRSGLYAREDEWALVEAPPGRRGILTHASVLTLTSHPTSTSPVKRGHWLLETVLGDAPPPAPPDAPDLAETVAAAPGLTLREQLARHRQDAACAGCHKLMDPLGLAFENFDAIGAWRDEVDGAPVDASGELDGQGYSGPEGLIALVQRREGVIARHFAERLLVYALGRGLTARDHGAVDGIARAAKDDGYRLSAFVRGVVLSEPFRGGGVDHEASGHAPPGRLPEDQATPDTGPR